jgi:hypothetical protein
MLFKLKYILITAHTACYLPRLTMAVQLPCTDDITEPNLHVIRKAAGNRYK